MSRACSPSGWTRSAAVGRLVSGVLPLDVALEAYIWLARRRRRDPRLVLPILLDHRSFLDRIDHNTGCEACCSDRERPHCPSKPSSLVAKDPTALIDKFLQRVEHGEPREAFLRPEVTAKRAGLEHGELSGLERRERTYCAGTCCTDTAYPEHRRNVRCEGDQQARERQHDTGLPIERIEVRAACRARTGRARAADEGTAIDHAATLHSGKPPPTNQGGLVVEITTDEWT